MYAVTVDSNFGKRCVSLNTINIGIVMLIQGLSTTTNLYKIVDNTFLIKLRSFHQNITGRSFIMSKPIYIFTLITPYIKILDSDWFTASAFYAYFNKGGHFYSCRSIFLKNMLFYPPSWYFPKRITTSTKIYLEGFCFIA